MAKDDRDILERLKEELAFVEQDGSWALMGWEAEFSIRYFQYLQNRSRKMYVQAMHTVHALPDLRVAEGRLRDVFLLKDQWFASRG